MYVVYDIAIVSFRDDVLRPCILPVSHLNGSLMNGKSMVRASN